jgi:CheY-like chemotaxis protein
MAKILLVDDTEMMRAMIKEILVGEGHEVIDAKDSLQALEILKHEKFDVLISDNSMPGMDGEMQDNAGRVLLEHELARTIPTRILISSLIAETSYNKEHGYTELSKHNIREIIRIINEAGHAAPKKPTSEPNR